MPVVPPEVASSITWPFIVMQLLLGLMVALPGIITALRQSSVMKQQRETHDLVNSRLTKLLEVVESASRAEGVLAGKAEAHAKETIKDAAERAGRDEMKAISNALRHADPSKQTQ